MIFIFKLMIISFFFCVGNNEFYSFLESHALVIFGPTIHTGWNSHNSNLKKELLDYPEGLFGVGTFDRTTVAQVVGKYLKYTRDTYRTQLQFNPRYEHPLAVQRVSGEHSSMTEKRKGKRKKEKCQLDPQGKLQL